MDAATTIVLSNGIRVANFSSPHPFLFETGETLAACSPERAKGLMLLSSEEEVPNPGGWTDIRLEFRMSEAVKAALDELQGQDDIDIVLVPLPVMTALRAAGMDPGKCRVIRVADRVTKAIHAGRFCL